VRNPQRSARLDAYRDAGEEVDAALHLTDPVGLGEVACHRSWVTVWYACFEASLIGGLPAGGGRGIDRCVVEGRPLSWVPS